MLADLGTAFLFVGHVNGSLVDEGESLGKETKGTRITIASTRYRYRSWSGWGTTDALFLSLFLVPGRFEEEEEGAPQSRLPRGGCIVIEIQLCHVSGGVDVDEFGLAAGTNAL